MTNCVFPATTPPRLPIIGSDEVFPVHRIYCVGRNFAEHAAEMGAVVERGQPMFFMKPADALVVGDGAVAYPTATNDLHHEVELVVAIGRDATDEISLAQAPEFIFAFAVGLDLTRRDLQAIAKEKRHPWDIAKGFDQSAPISALRRAHECGDISHAVMSFQVNNQQRQHARLDAMVFNVSEVIVALSKLFLLRAGDLIFMGTPAGVAALQRGDQFHARIENIAELRGHIV